MTATNKDKLRKRLKKKRKQRERRERETPVDLTPASGRQSHRFSRYHLDVLQNIEFSLVTCYREDPHDEIDDAAVMRALRRTLMGETPDASPAGLLMEALAGVRGTREDVSDEVWNTGLRVVMASVDNHSSRAPGEVSYLEFVCQFIPG
jgi:hypothetical protein